MIQMCFKFYHILLTGTLNSGNYPDFLLDYFPGTSLSDGGLDGGLDGDFAT